MDGNDFVTQSSSGGGIPNGTLSALLPSPNDSSSSVQGGSAPEVDGVVSVFEVIESVVNVSVGIVGLIGAVVVVLVYTWRHNPTPSELIITALSVVDLLYNVFNNISNLLLDKLTGQREQLFLIAFSSCTFSFTLVSSFLLISTISINRWFAICRPLTYMTSFSKSKVRNVLLGIFGVSVVQGAVCFGYYFTSLKLLQEIIDVQNYMVYNILVITALAIMFYSYFHIIKTFQLQNERLRRRPMPTSMQTMHKENHSEHDREEMKPCTSAQANEVGGGGEPNETDNGSVPPPALAIEEENSQPPRRVSLGVQAAVDRKESQPVSSNSSRSASRDPKNKVTFTLFVISTCFLICVCPFLIFENLVFFLKWDQSKREVQVGRKLTRILFLLNFVSNPIIYFATSQIFRERLGALLRFVIPERVQKLFEKRPSPADRQSVTRATTQTGRPSIFSSRV